MADATPASGEQQPEKKGAEAPQTNGAPKKSRRGLILIIVLILAIAAGAFYWHSTYYEDTDDAQVSGHLVQISTRINGTGDQDQRRRRESVHQQRNRHRRARPFRLPGSRRQRRSSACDSAVANASAATKRMSPLRRQTPAARFAPPERT